MHVFFANPTTIGEITFGDTRASVIRPGLLFLRSSFPDFDAAIFGSTFSVLQVPATLALFGIGLAGLGFSRHKRAS